MAKWLSENVSFKYLPGLKILQTKSTEIMEVNILYCIEFLEK
jgi:hypothetical protein